MATPTPTPEVPESDKPFILALVSAAMTVLSGIMEVIGGYLGNAAMASAADEVFKTTLPLTATAWGYYFATKQSQ